MGEYDSDEYYDEPEPTETEQSVSEAARKLAKVFPQLPSESVADIVSAITRQAVEHTKRELVGSLREQVQKAVMGEMERESSELIKQTLANVLAERVVRDGKTYSWNDEEQKPLTIKDVIKKELEDATSALKVGSRKDDFVKEAVETFMSKELTKIANQAVSEFREEVVSDIKKEGMKQIVVAVTGAVKNDRKLLSLLS